MRSFDPNNLANGPNSCPFLGFFHSWVLSSKIYLNSTAGMNQLTGMNHVHGNRLSRAMIPVLHVKPHCNIVPHPTAHLHGTDDFFRSTEVEQIWGYLDLSL